MAEHAYYIDHAQVDQEAQAPRRHHRPSPARFGWWLTCSLAVIILIPAVSTILGVKLHNGGLTSSGESTPFDGRTVVIGIDLVAVDPVAGTMKLDWTISSDSATKECNPKAPTDVCLASSVDIFFDNNLLRSDGSAGGTATSDLPTAPIFIFNATGFALNIEYNNSPVFRTSIALFNHNGHSDPTYYPFDEYSGEIFLFARDSQTNATVGLLLGKTGGTAVGFNTKAVDVADLVGVIDVMVDISRGRLIQFYSVVIIIATWAITLIIMMVMVTSVFFGYKQRIEVMILPVGTLFAFLQLRSSMPGAPTGFGDIVDYVSLLPCLAVLAISASVSLGAFLIYDPSENGDELITLKHEIRERLRFGRRPRTSGFPKESQIK